MQNENLCLETLKSTQPIITYHRSLIKFPKNARTLSIVLHLQSNPLILTVGFSWVFFFLCVRFLGWIKLVHLLRGVQECENFGQIMGKKLPKHLAQPVQSCPRPGIFWILFYCIHVPARKSCDISRE